MALIKDLNLALENNAGGGPPDLGSRPYWLVGSAFGGNRDQTERFLRDSVREIDQPTERYAAMVRSMTVGDRVALKSSFVQRHVLPFDNSGRDVSVMPLKARGTITANPGDGERLSVEWDRGFEPRNRYFYTF